MRGDLCAAHPDHPGLDWLQTDDSADNFRLAATDQSGDAASTTFAVLQEFTTCSLVIR
jgi:hypothetical protein